MVSQSQSPAHIYTSDTAPDFKALVKAKKKPTKKNNNSIFSQLTRRKQNKKTEYLQKM